MKYIEQTASVFSLHQTDQQGSSCFHNFLTVTQSYHSKVNPIGALHAEKIAEAFLLFIIAFPASLLLVHVIEKSKFVSPYIVYSALQQQPSIDNDSETSVLNLFLHIPCIWMSSRQTLSSHLLIGCLVAKHCLVTL